jgi:hypothetical protein
MLPALFMLTLMDLLASACRTTLTVRQLAFPREPAEVIGTELSPSLRANISKNITAKHVSLLHHRGV